MSLFEVPQLPQSSTLSNLVNLIHDDVGGQVGLHLLLRIPSESIYLGETFEYIFVILLKESEGNSGLT
jgi:hypothetical protein